MANAFIQKVNLNYSFQNNDKSVVFRLDHFHRNPLLIHKEKKKEIYPFKTGPRFYFYKPLPFVLKPEPFPFSEEPLLYLNMDAGTRRLLPDDQLKKLFLDMQNQNLEMRKKLVFEEDSLQFLSNMYRLFYFVAGAKELLLKDKPILQLNKSWRSR